MITRPTLHSLSLPPPYHPNAPLILLLDLLQSRSQKQLRAPVVHRHPATVDPWAQTTLVIQPSPVTFRCPPFPSLQRPPATALMTCRPLPSTTNSSPDSVPQAETSVHVSHHPAQTTMSRFSKHPLIFRRTSENSKLSDTPHKHTCTFRRTILYHHPARLNTLIIISLPHIHQCLAFASSISELCSS